MRSLTRLRASSVALSTSVEGKGCALQPQAVEIALLSCITSSAVPGIRFLFLLRDCRGAGPVLVPELASSRRASEGSGDIDAASDGDGETAASARTRPWKGRQGPCVRPVDGGCDSSDCCMQMIEFVRAVVHAMDHTEMLAKRDELEAVTMVREVDEFCAARSFPVLFLPC